MNTQNETIINPEMMKQLREVGMNQGYEPVPKELEEKAKRLLGHTMIADMDSSFKRDVRRRLRNFNKRMRRRGVAGY